MKTKLHLCTVADNANTNSIFFVETQEVLNTRSTSLVSENWIKFIHNRRQCKQISPIRVYFFFLETQEVFNREGENGLICRWNWIKFMHSSRQCKRKSIFFPWKLRKFLNARSTSLVSENWIKFMHSRRQCKQTSPSIVYFCFREDSGGFWHAIGLFGQWKLN